MACAAGGGHSDKGEDAGRAGAVRAEACVGRTGSCSPAISSGR